MVVAASLDPALAQQPDVPEFVRDDSQQPGWLVRIGPVDGTEIMLSVMTRPGRPGARISRR